MEKTTIESLDDYRRMAWHAVSNLTRLRDIAQRLHFEPSVIKLVDEVLTRHKKHKFSIAVVGEFKRGKSTFINALLGKEILPSDVVPCSATLTRITYGLTPSAKIVFKAKGQQEERIEEIEIDQLADYVTRLTPEAEKTAAQVKEAIVYYPVSYCRNNVNIIDTPGLNDDEVKLGVLRHASAVILVTMVTAPFRMAEVDFLQNELLLSEMGRVIFIVNAIDRIRRKRDRKRILDIIQTRIETLVEKRLAEQFGQDSEDYRIYRKRIGTLKVFAVSSLDALEGKIDKDEALLADSGFLEFEQALDKFLTETRPKLDLQVLANRTVATSDEILKKLKVEAKALQMNQKKFEESYNNTLPQLESLRQRGKEELRQFEQSSQRRKQRVQHLLGQLEEELKAAADEVIEEAHIKPEDLQSKKIDALFAKLARKVSQAVQNKGKRVGEKIQIEIERDLLKELRDFTIIVEQTLQNIELQFAEVEVDRSTEKGAAAESSAMAVYTDFGEIWPSYHEAGVKEAGVGAVAYDALKEKVIGEVDASIEQIQSTLDKLREQKARNEVLTERRGQEIAEIRREVQTIRRHAHRLSQQLIEITSV